MWWHPEQHGFYYASYEKNLESRKQIFVLRSVSEKDKAIMFDSWQAAKRAGWIFVNRDFFKNKN